MKNLAFFLYVMAAPIPFSEGWNWNKIQLLFARCSIVVVLIYLADMILSAVISMETFLTGVGLFLVLLGLLVNVGWKIFDRTTKFHAATTKRHNRTEKILLLLADKAGIDISKIREEE